MSDLELVKGSPVVARPSDPASVAYTDLDYTISAETAERLMRRQPPNTRRAYDWHWSQFETWCQDEGRVALPATQQTLADYVARLMGISLSPATIDSALGTIRSRHSDAGFENQPPTKRPLELLRAYRREWADAGGRVRKATPVLLDALRAMVDTCDPATLAGLRDRSILLMGFNGMCRRSELSGLDLGDVAESAEEGISIHIRYSKTDKDAQGVEVAVPFGQHAETCVVRATRAWVAALAGRGFTEGPLYRPIDRHGHIGGEAKALSRKSARLAGESISTVVHRRAQLAGLPGAEGYTGHSLRAGGATSAYLAGAPVAEIAKHGRWSEKSPVVLGYIRAVDKWRNNPMKGIGL